MFETIVACGVLYLVFQSTVLIHKVRRRTDELGGPEAADSSADSASAGGDGCETQLPPDE